MVIGRAISWPYRCIQKSMLDLKVSLIKLIGNGESVMNEMIFGLILYLWIDDQLLLTWMFGHAHCQWQLEPKLSCLLLINGFILVAVVYYPKIVNVYLYPAEISLAKWEERELRINREDWLGWLKQNFKIIPWARVFGMSIRNLSKVSAWGLWHLLFKSK